MFPTAITNKSDIAGIPARNSLAQQMPYENYITHMKVNSQHASPSMHGINIGILSISNIFI